MAARRGDALQQHARSLLRIRREDQLSLRQPQVFDCSPLCSVDDSHQTTTLCFPLCLENKIRKDDADRGGECAGCGARCTFSERSEGDHASTEEGEATSLGPCSVRSPVLHGASNCASAVLVWSAGLATCLLLMDVHCTSSANVAVCRTLSDWPAFAASILPRIMPMTSIKPGSSTESVIASCMASLNGGG